MREQKLVPIHTGALDTFPASQELPAGAIEVRWTDEMDAMIDFRLDVPYDERDGETLMLQILLPMDGFFAFGPPKKYPLIVYVPGSAWHRQMPKMSITQMMKYCELGYAVAIVQYRPSEVRGFPAQIEDAKTAVRFMRKNAAEYKIDPDKIVFFGDSSGGHTAVAAGVTGEGTLDNGTYGEFSCAVKGIIDCFGPSDVSKMNYYPSAMDHVGADSPEGMFLGGVNVLENPELAEKASPMHYLSREKATPPILIMHGDGDQLVPFNQSVLLYERLRELDKDVTMYKLLGASHGMGGFNSREARDVIDAFIKKCVGNE